MTFKKGARVEVSANGSTYAGLVDSAKAGKVVAILDDGRRTKPIEERHFRASTRAIPAGSVNASTWAKGDRVEFDTDEGVVVHATVTHVTTGNVRVMADGGAAEYTVGKSLLRASTKALPVPEPSPMDRWGVTSYKAARAMSEETEAFTAVVTLDGKAVLKASNRGQGGCNVYHGDRAARDAFDEDARAWATLFGYPDMMEPSDAWIGFVQNVRPYATSDRQHVEGMVAEMQAMYAPRLP